MEALNFLLRKKLRLQDLSVKDEIPVLDLGLRMGQTDYIDFLKVRDLAFPLMRGIDRYQRAFIALLVPPELRRKTRIEHKVKFQLHFDDYERVEVLVIFNRYSGGLQAPDGHIWVTSGPIPDKQLRNQEGWDIAKKYFDAALLLLRSRPRQTFRWEYPGDVKIICEI